MGNQAGCRDASQQQENIGLAKLLAPWMYLDLSSIKIFTYILFSIWNIFSSKAGQEMH